jgi:Ca-activated chloride channel family protein
MKQFIYALSFVLLLGCFALASNMSTTLAQQTAQPKPTPRPTPDASGQTPDVVNVTINRVRLPISVLDKKGQPIGGLTANDFQILEDKLPQVIETFADEKQNVPLYVGVMMDTSASTAGKLKFEQESAKNFIYTVTRLRKDKVAFVTFDDDINLRQDFTDKMDLLDRAVESVKKPGTHTALYDAVWQFCDEKMRSAQGVRVIVVVTDGEDTYSRATLRDAIDIAQRTETSIFAISTKAGFAGTVPGVEAGTVMDSGDKDLVKLCEETGGAAFFTGDLLALERAFGKISKQLHSQYIVTYKPTNNTFDGSYRRIEVKLANSRDGLKIRAKKGYAAIVDSIRK